MESALPQENSDMHCHNCGVELKGKYCHSCGQKKIEPSERTIKYFFIQFLGSAFFLENNFLKNVWYVVARPGRQALDFIEGRQKRWMPPFSLFLLINLFYFWYTPLSDMNLTLHEQLAQDHHAGAAAKMVANRLGSRQISMAEYEEQYNAKSSGYSNSLIILHVPLLALVLMGLFYQKQKFFVDYFVVALYFMAFMLLMALGVVSFINIALWVYPLVGNFMDDNFSWMLVICLATFTIIYFRNIFSQPWLWTILKTPVFLMLLYVVHMAYRTILFFVIFAAT